MATLKDALKKELTKKELNLVPRAFDTIGTIAIFTQFPDELKKKEKIIAQKILELHKNLETVAKKTEQYSGKYRLQRIKIIAGKRTKETLHRENGVQIKLDVENCYFSPRTSSERLRIANLVRKNESVLVMFSGVAPFPLVIAKHAHPKEIYAIEANPTAHKYALENVKLNKFKNMNVIKGDVKKVLPKINKKFDRILMPLPKSAEQYLNMANTKLKPKGIIHFYDFAKKEEFPKSSLKKIQKYLKKFKVKDRVLCGQYSPRAYRVCIDIQPL